MEELSGVPRENVRNRILCASNATSLSSAEPSIVARTTPPPPGAQNQTPQALSSTIVYDVLPCSHVESPGRGMKFTKRSRSWSYMQRPESHVPTQIR